MNNCWRPRRSGESQDAGAVGVARKLWLSYCMEYLVHAPPCRSTQSWHEDPCGWKAQKGSWSEASLGQTAMHLISGVPWPLGASAWRTRPLSSAQELCCPWASPADEPLQPSWLQAFFALPLSQDHLTPLVTWELQLVRHWCTGSLCCRIS